MASALVEAPLAVTRAFSPGHITGFFEMPQACSDSLHMGSTGAGFSIDRGIATTVSVFESSKSEYRIFINGVQAYDAEVSKWVVEKYLKLARKSYFVNVEHDITIPVGFGIGSSGAAALSLSYALNEALHIGLTKIQAAQIAHNAEIACKTGLGTVIAEFVGGFEIRTKRGAPGVGSVSRFDLESYKAVMLCLAPISTKSFLSNRINEINGLGGVMINKLSASMSVEEFLVMSCQFAETLGLTQGYCNKPIAALKARHIESSVALFGQTVFTVVPQERANEAKEALASFGGTILVCNIDKNGARVL